MKELREGFTTGSCAAAAALACCIWHRDGTCPHQVEIVVPEGRHFIPEIIAHENGACGVIKDAGDDPDITNGLEIIARVALSQEDGPICFEAGEGVGTVTQPGLKIPVGEAAINPIPREMIEGAVRSVYPRRAARVVVSIPGGEQLSRKTFNPRLGIVNGLSVLGTSGVVRPMSEEALKSSLFAELRMRSVQGYTNLGFTFGNQGEAAMKLAFPRLCVVQVSNEIGFMLDAALELGIRHLTIAGHPGKLVKLSAGVMQTHSRMADARREVIAAHLALMGAPLQLLKDVMECVTTDGAMEAIHAAGFDGVWDRLARAAQNYCSERVRGEIGISIAFLDVNGKVLGKWMEGEQ